MFNALRSDLLSLPVKEWMAIQNRLKPSSPGKTFRFSNRRDVLAKTKRNNGTSSNTKTVVVSASSSPSTSNRKYNFSAGPAMLPLDVLEEAQKDLVDYKGTGMSVLEMSHRGKDFMSIAAKAERDFRELVNVPENYKVIFVQGGASTMFASNALNLCPTGKGESGLRDDGRVVEEGVGGGEEVLRRRRSGRRVRRVIFQPFRREIRGI